MPSSHPPTLVTLARRALGSLGLPRGSRLLVAVSGGPDSMALLHVLALLREKAGFILHAHGVDHGLRSDAAGELEQAARFATVLDVPWAHTLVQVPTGGNLQARARAARLAALRAAAANVKAMVIATAHHADDRAETVLLRLLRGASPDGLAVLPSRNADLVRPFLRARRSDILAHISRHAIPYARDPSNFDPRFLRTRVRRELLPLLEELSPGIVSHLCGLADDLLARRELSDGLPEEAYLPPLPRPTRAALASLARSRSRTGRVPLPHGLVATVEPRERK